MNEQLPTVTVDVRHFVLGNSIDTCAIWNLLSSARLGHAARARRCWFAVAGYVRYEALDRARSGPTEGETSMQQQLRERLSRQQDFREVSLSVPDLAAVAVLGDAKRLGRGEIAAMALALKMRCALMTDDQRARKLAAKVGVQPVQTTPHLVGWLGYEGEIGDADIATIITEHEQFIPTNRGLLTKFFRAIWHQVCHYRLISYRAVNIQEKAAD